MPDRDEDLLAAFAAWFPEQAAWLFERGFAAVVAPPTTTDTTDHPAQYADIDAEDGRLLGRATLWATGDCTLEAVDADTGTTLFQERHTFPSAAALDAGLHGYVERLAQVKRATEYPNLV